MTARAPRALRAATPEAPHAPTASRLPEPLAPDVRARLESLWAQAYAARDQADLRGVYSRWAETYDADHAAIGFRGHVLTATEFATALPPELSPRVLDAGAGTGLAGAALHRRGYRHLTALDLSTDMLARAEDKQVYERLLAGDLAGPLDAFPNGAFDGAVLVGVFSYGQAPAHALDEIVRVVRPGGVIAFTLRSDFHAEDAMGVASRMADLERAGRWRPLAVSAEAPYLPAKDPEAMFRVWTFEVLDNRPGAPGDDFSAAVDAAFTGPAEVHALAHHHIWDAMASRLYEAYIQRPEYYLNACEEEILQVNAGDFLGDHALCVELGCGSARKIRHVFEAALQGGGDGHLDYMPIDVSPGALAATVEQIGEAFGDRVRVEPRLGAFDETLASIPADRAKAIFFLGGSIGNFETRDETVDFLASIRERMTDRDRFVVGFDLCKDAHVIEGAYNAGEPNRTFFVHMARRMNHLLDADFDLDALALDSRYVEEAPRLGLGTWRVELRVVSTRDQQIGFGALGRRVALGRGDALQVGISRKFNPDDIATLATLAGLRVRSMWFDSKHHFAMGELVRDDAPLA